MKYGQTVRHSSIHVASPIDFNPSVVQGRHSRSGSNDLIEVHVISVGKDLRLTSLGIGQNDLQKGSRGAKCSYIQGAFFLQDIVHKVVDVHNFVESNGIYECLVAEKFYVYINGFTGLPRQQIGAIYCAGT